MGKVVLDVTVSLDGFIAGPNDDVERLHQWLYELDSWRARHGLAGGETVMSSEVVDEAFEKTGAVVMGRRTFEIGEEPWGDNPPFQMPVFVLSHEPREKIVKEGGTTFTFVTDGIESALDQARAAAGDKDVGLMGANTAQQYLRAGLLDELNLHLVPVLLGAGIHLFEEIDAGPIELETTRVIEAPGVTHLRFRAVR